jgi:hypothetical protein
MTLRTAGSISWKHRGSLTILPTKGYLLISTVDQQTDSWYLLRQERERRGLLRQHRPVAAMAGLHGSLESSGFPVSDHQSTRNRHQSNEKGNANTSTPFRKATTVWGRNAARDGGGAIAGLRKLRKHLTQSTTAQKKSRGRKRRRWWAHQNDEEGPQSTRKPGRRTTATS